MPGYRLFNVGFEGTSLSVPAHDKQTTGGLNLKYTSRISSGLTLDHGSWTLVVPFHPEPGHLPYEILQ